MQSRKALCAISGNTVRLQTPSPRKSPPPSRAVASSKFEKPPAETKKEKFRVRNVVQKNQQKKEEEEKGQSQTVLAEQALQAWADELKPARAPKEEEEEEEEEGVPPSPTYELSDDECLPVISDYENITEGNTDDAIIEEEEELESYLFTPKPREREEPTTDEAEVKNVEMKKKAQSSRLSLSMWELSTALDDEAVTKLVAIHPWKVAMKLTNLRNLNSMDVALGLGIGLEIVKNFVPSFLRF